MAGAPRPRARGDHEAVPGRPRQRPASTSTSAAARCTRCSARTAPGKSTLMNVLYGLYDPDEGEILVNGEAGHVSLAEGCDRARDRHGAPALHAHPGDDGRREHRPRHRAERGGRSSSTTAPRDVGSRISRTSFGFAIDPDAQDRGHHRRPAAARRDPEGALPQRGHPHPRRADRGADAAGGRRALRDPRETSRARACRSSSSATS